MGEIELIPKPLSEPTEFDTIQKEEVLDLNHKDVPRTYIACNDDRLNYTFLRKKM